MLIAKGTKVEMVLEGGGRVKPHAPMLHDEDGADWPYDSVLFMPFSKKGTAIEDEKAARNRKAIQYFGYVPLAGKIHLPPRGMRSWGQVGEVHEILYTRPGEKPEESESYFSDIFKLWKRPDRNLKGDYIHAFRGGYLIFKTGFPVLYEARVDGRRVYRLEFPPWSKINWRGFVRP